jgi:tetratricopeptide (TPR) repeat protein
VTDVSRRLAAGRVVDEAAIALAHPDLLPELGEQLHRVRLLNDARELAQRAGPERPPTTAREVTLDEELEVLREALTQYEVLERVQYGGQGVVYRARQRGTNRMVALKLLLDGPLASPHQRHRFAREIELVARLHHPNIVTVFESGVVRERNFYAMEFVEGLPIDDYMVGHDLSPREIVRLMVKVCGAVHHAHQNGVLHRDLNPANILVDEAGEPRVFDFGLARDLWSDGQDGRHSYTAPGCGTIPYLSPEQAGGDDGQADTRSDIYALGLILYELLTEMLPYPIKGNPATVRNALLYAEPLPLHKAIARGGYDRAPGLDTINCDLEAVLAKALAKAKSDRYQAAGDLADDLERWLAGDAVRARLGTLYALRKLLRRHRLGVAVSAAVLAGLLIAGVATAISVRQVWRERDNARHAARLAYGLFDSALTDVEESVRPLAGGVAVRDRLVGQLSDKLPELAALARSDAALDPIATRLLEKQGDLAAEQGRRSEAAGFYQVFLDRCLREAAQQPSNADCPADALRAYRKLAELSEAPVPLYERGIALGDEAVARYPWAQGLRYEQCQLRLAFAHQARVAGDHERSLDESEHVLALCPPEQGDATLPVRWLSTLARALSNQGLNLQEIGDAPAAEERMERSLTLREAILAQAPSDTEARLALAKSCVHIGGQCRDRGEMDRAKTYFRKAAEHSDLLAVVEPNSVAWDQTRYAAHHRLASLCLDTGEPVEAEAHGVQAVAIAQAWAARDPSEDSQTAVYYGYQLQGKLQRNMESWAEARRSYEQALAVAEDLLARNPENPTQMLQVAYACDGIGCCSRDLGDASDAVAQSQRAVELILQASNLQPEAISSKLALFQAKCHVARAHLDLPMPSARARAEAILVDVEAALGELRTIGRLTGKEHQYNTVLTSIEECRDILRGCVAPTTQDDAAFEAGASDEHRAP